MLPYFKIIFRKTDMQEPIKPRRTKKWEVPVHGQKTFSDAPKASEGHKTFSANFNGRHAKPQTETHPHSEHSENVHKISRRYLTKENERLLQVNQELVNAQDHLSKKNCKLKEKLTQAVGVNEELANENNLIRLQYQELVNQYNECLQELERPKVCQNCVELNDLVDRTKRDYAVLRKKNQELHEDCGMLKNVVYRLNVQLERYQQKLHKHKIPIIDHKDERKNDVNASTVAAEELGLGASHYDHTHSPISWGKVNAHTLAPLLNAYQEIILEKEEIIDGYQSELGEFTGKLKDIITENESLHVKLNEDVECSKVLSAQLEGLKVELKSTKEQNDLLIKKCALKQDKIEEILKCYEQKIDQLKRDYTVLQDQYCRSKTEISGLKEKNKSLTEVHDDFKHERSQYIPISVHNSSVNECKRWYEELKHQYELEKAKMSDTMEQLKEQVGDLTAKIGSLNAEKMELDGRLKTADKHIKKVETRFLELEHNLHEVQLSRSACRKQLHKAMSFARDLVNEQESLLRALNQRHHENKVVKKLGTDIASRMDILRNQLKTVQKEAWQELSTVEERIQEQDSMITSMKEEHEEEVERLKQIIREKESGNLLFKDNSSTQQTQFVLYKEKGVNK